LLNSAGADVLVGPVAVVSQPAAQSGIAAVTTQITAGNGNSQDNHSPAVVLVTQVGPVLQDSNNQGDGNPGHGNKDDNDPGSKSAANDAPGHSKEDGSDGLVSSVVNLGTGTVGGVTHAVVPAATEVVTPGELVLLIQFGFEVTPPTLVEVPTSEPGSSPSHPQVSGGVQAGSLGIAGALAALSDPAAQGIAVARQSPDARNAGQGAANPNGLANEAPPSLAQNAPGAVAGQVLSSLAWSVPALGTDLSLSAAGRWWAALGANPTPLSGDADADALDRALQEPRSGLVEGTDPTALGKETGGMFNLAAASSRLLEAVGDLEALDRAFQDFLEGMGDLRQTLTGWVARVGPTPWLLMGLALTLTVHEEILRRRRQVQESKDAEEKLAGDPFAVAAT
jgi:hypothetical protein